MSTKPAFEQSLTSLEDKVRKLESGELPLDEALKLFEEGVELAKTCHEALDAAEQRVAALSQGPGGPTAEPLDDPS